MRLVERWRNDVVCRALSRLLTYVVSEVALERFGSERHWLALGEAAAYHFGRMLLNPDGSPVSDIRARHVRSPRTGSTLTVSRPNNPEPLANAVDQALSHAPEDTAPAVEFLMAAEAFGRAALATVPGADWAMRSELEETDRHVWTPHSLADIKDENLRNRPEEERRDLRFCERRSHERLVCHRTRAFAATSAEMAERLHTHYRVPVESIFYFPPGVDSDEFRPYTADKKKSTYGYLEEISGVERTTLENGKIVFETSRMVSNKRKDLLLDAFAKVAAVHDDAYLFIGGGLRTRSSNRFGIESNPTLHFEVVRFLTGFIPDEQIGPLFSVADVYASASEMEGFGMSVSQAAAAGTAIVSSDLIPFSVQYVSGAAAVVPAGSVGQFCGSS